MKTPTARSTLLAVLAGGALVLAALPSAADGSRGGFGGGMDRIVKLAHALDLSREQRDQVYAIVDEARPAMREQLETLMTSRERLREATRDGAYDEARVRAIAEEHGRSVAELIVLKTRTRALVYDVLTPEQRDELAELETKRRHGRRHGRRGMRGSWDGGAPPNTEDAATGAHPAQAAAVRL